MQDMEVCLQIVTNVVFFINHQEPTNHKGLSFKV